MHDLTISRSLQIAVLGGALVAVSAAVARQMPEIKRYLKIESM